MDNFYEKVAKAGWLGTKAKVSAESGKADWSNKQKADKPVDQSEAMKRRQAKLGSVE